MSSIVEANLSETENTCVVCFKNVEIYSIGVCDHAVCYECSTRMRVLCRQNECPICRQDMPKVIFTREVEPYVILRPKAERSNLQDRKFGMLFCSGSLQQAYHHLLEHNCHICARKERRWPFKNFQQLKDHMRREHELFYCDLCVANLKIFTFERRCYTRSELALHRRKGDVDNTSHRGHPLCEFCDTRYMDSDELFRHLRRDHLYCHFCDADGKHQYYNSYEDLRTHFLEEHYLCEEGDCKNEQFTSVFRTDIDLRAHIANTHSRHMSKSATKQARTLELEFTLAPRARDQGGRGGGGRRPIIRPEREDDEEGAVGYDTYYMEPGGNRLKESNMKPFVNPMSSEEFPSLGSEVPASSRPTSSVTFTSKISPNPFSGEDFPSLGKNTPSTRSSNVTSAVIRAPEVTITRTIRGSENLIKNSHNFPALGSACSNSTVRFSVSSNNSQDKPQSARSNVSIHVNHQPNGTITTKITTTPTSTIQVRPKTTEAFPALGSASIPEVKWVHQKNKKFQEPKPSSKAVPAPVLPPSSLSDFPVLSKSGKNEVKKRSSVVMPVSNSWVNLNNFNTESRSANAYTPQQEDAPPADEASKKETKKRDGQKSGTKIRKHELKTKGNVKEYVETKPTEKDVNKIKKKREKQQQQQQKISNNVSDPKPSASNDEVNLNGEVNGVVNKLFELKLVNGGLEDFPALQPPPGIHIKPPPGFDAMNRSNDLTFTSSSGQSYTIFPTGHEYHLPPNFEARNKKLVEKFMTVVDNGEVIMQFKHFSKLFREGTYTAENYYEHCKNFLRGEFANIFPELLALLPDINKQQELYRIHVRDSDDKNLDVCCTCNQVVRVRDLKSHVVCHTLENHFPVLGLGQSGEPANNYWKK